MEPLGSFGRVTTISGYLAMRGRAAHADERGLEPLGRVE